MKHKSKPQSSKLFGRLTRDGRQIELPVADLEPAAYPQHVYLRGWWDGQFHSLIVQRVLVTVYAKE